MIRRPAVSILALALTCALSPGWALAQDGTAAEQEACTPDVFRLCQDFIPNEGPIVACLKAKHAQLSAACEPVMFPHVDTMPTTEAPATHRKRRRHHKAI